MYTCFLLAAFRLPLTFQAPRVSLRGMADRQSSFRVRHQMNVTFSTSVRNVLDELAQQYGILYEPVRIPRDAELVRLLLVAELTSDKTERERVACALYCNSVLTLSGYFAQVVATLRTNIGDMAGRVASTAGVEPEQRRPREALPPGQRSSRCRVYLTIDDWIRYRLEERLDGSDNDLMIRNDGRALVAPDLKLVNRLLEKSLSNVDRHRLLLKTYSDNIDGIQRTLADAVSRERNRLARMLDNIAV